MHVMAARMMFCDQPSTAQTLIVRMRGKDQQGFRAKHGS
jgi:hypothetical protein